MSTAPWRLVAGSAVVLLLAAIGVLLAPPYLENWKLQRYLANLVEDSTVATKTPVTIQNMVVKQAAGLGLPVHGEDVRVTAANGSVHIQVLYIVRVDLPLYTVDLHFRPEAGGA